MISKKDAISDFLIGAMVENYSLDTAWNLLLGSIEGKSILSGENFNIGIGYELAKTAINKITLRDREDDGYMQTISPFHIDLLANFIEMAHKQFGIAYEHIFDKMSIGKFYKECGIVLGNYDDKLLKRYLL